MNLLFVHETKIKEDEYGNYYTSGSYNKDVWDRYMKLSSTISVIARKENTIYSFKRAQANFNHLDKEKIKLIFIPNLKDSVKSFLNIKMRSHKNSIIENEVLKSDCIIVRLPCDSGYSAIKYCHKHSKPYFVEVVGCVWDSLWNYNLLGKILAPYNYLKLKRFVYNAPYVLYVTTHFLQNRYPTKGKSIGCSDVKLDNVNDSVLDKRLEKISEMDKNHPTILGTTAAIDVRYKGQEYVIRAISKLKKKGYKFEYHLAGGGSSEYLKRIALKYDVVDEVKFLGPIPHHNVQDFLDNLDIYIQPSKQEGLPRALIEALSRACPSIGSNAGGIPELLNSEFIFKKGDTDEISKILISMDQKTMIKEAVRSFNKSKEYEKEKLNNMRSVFYSSFVNESSRGNFI